MGTLRCRRCKNRTIAGGGRVAIKSRHNKTARRNAMELVPLGPGFGVEVRGVSLLDVATDAQAYKAVRSAFESHSLLVFRDQTIADDIQVAYSRAFGPLELTKVASLGSGGFYSRLTNLDEKGEIVPPDHRQVLVAKANGLWHTDSSFKKTPALASGLTARVLPGTDGDTEC